MKTTDIKEKIAKLPAWAREHIRSLERERNCAVRGLSEFLDKQTPSAIFVESMVGHDVGELLPGGVVQKHYIQTHAIAIEHAGVRLRVGVYDNNAGRDCIHLQWESITGWAGVPVAFIPQSFQSAQLKAKENMR